MKLINKTNITQYLVLIFATLLLMPFGAKANSANFPNGILLKATNNPKVYYIENGKRRPIESPNMLRSQFRWDDLVVSTPVEVDSVPMGAEMTYRDGSLLSNRGAVYVISDGTRRPIESASTFLQKGYKWSNVIAVSDSELAPHPQGSILTAADKHPNGSLLLRPGGEVYTIKNGQRRYIPSPLIFEARYRWEYLIPVSEEYLNTYPRGENEFYPDGLLIASATGVYMMQNNVRQPITSPEVFESYGLNWGQVRRATDFELSIIPVSGAFSTVKTYREGSLIGAQSGAVYRVASNGVLQYIPSPNIFTSQGYSWDTIVRLPDRVVNQYTKSGRVGFANGALISYGGGVFLIENGLKRGIPSPAIFNARGFRWSNVIAVSEDEFNANAMGQALSDIQSASLDGYTIPATRGRTAREQHLVIDCNETDLDHYNRAATPLSAQNGIVPFRTGGAFAVRCPDGSRNFSYAVKSNRSGQPIVPFSVEEEKYYITMRWNYVRWYEATSNLSQNITSTSDRIPVNNASDFPNTGWVIIQGERSEIVAYSSKDGNSLVVSQRGVDSPNIAASPRSHNTGTVVQLVYEYSPDQWRGLTRSDLLNGSMSQTDVAKAWHRGKKVLVTNPVNGRRLVASIMEAGPQIFTNRVSGLSPEAMLALGIDTDANLEYGFLLDQSIPVGPLQ